MVVSCKCAQIPDRPEWHQDHTNSRFKNKKGSTLAGASPLGTSHIKGL